MSKIKKLIASLMLSVFLLTTVSASPVFAGQLGPWYLQSLPQWYTKVYDQSNRTEIFGERYTAAQVQWIMYGLYTFFLLTATGNNIPLVECFITQGNGGTDFTTCANGINDLVSYNGALDDTKFAATESGTVLEQFLADRPLSGITYFKQVGKRLNLVQEVNAQQGFGYNALASVQDLWASARNVSYALLIFAAIILAFMVMFRVKLSPQVVVTAQSAIPKLAIAIILIAFSYAIAGLLIDFMYVVLALLGFVLDPTNPGAQFQRMVAGPTQGGLFIDFVTYVIVFFATFVAAAVVGVGGTGGLAAGILLSPIYVFLGLIVAVILFVLLIWIWLRTIFVLLKTFALVIIKTIIFPFYLVAGIVIPGLGVWSWMRSYIADLAVFVVASLLLNVSFLFLRESMEASVASITNGGSPQGFLADFVASLPAAQQINLAVSPSNNWPPLVGAGLGTNLVYLGVSLILIFMIPKSADIITGIMSRRGFAVGTAIGEAMGPARFGGGLAGGANARALESLEASARTAGVSGFELQGGRGTEYTARRVAGSAISKFTRGGR